MRRLDAETFRRICMSFDVWVVGFGLSRALLGPQARGKRRPPTAPCSAAVLLDLYLLFTFFRSRRVALAAA